MKPLSEVKLALYSDEGTGERYEEKALIKSKMDYDKVGPDDVKGGALDNYDVLIVPGAFPLRTHEKGGLREFFRFYHRVGTELKDIIMDFTERGGGLIAICAAVGLFGRTIKFPILNSALGIKPMKIFDCDAKFGLKTGVVGMDIPEDFSPKQQEIAKEILGEYYEIGHFNTLYFRGPLLKYDHPQSDDEFILGVYSDTEPKHMRGKGGIAYKKYGRGNIIICSAHPEFSAFDLFDTFISYCAPGDGVITTNNNINTEIDLTQSQEEE